MAEHSGLIAKVPGSAYEPVRSLVVCISCLEKPTYRIYQTVCCCNVLPCGAEKALLNNTSKRSASLFQRKSQFYYRSTMWSIVVLLFNVVYYLLFFLLFYIFTVVLSLYLPCTVFLSVYKGALK